MFLLYGEGHKGFERLQSGILSVTEYQTLLYTTSLDCNLTAISLYEGSFDLSQHRYLTMGTMLVGSWQLRCLLQSLQFQQISSNSFHSARVTISEYGLHVKLSLWPLPHDRHLDVDVCGTKFDVYVAVPNCSKTLDVKPPKPKRATWWVMNEPLTILRNSCLIECQF